MSGHHHDDTHSIEQKPVSFTVPFYLALATLTILVLFLSLCDPKSHHADMEQHGHGQAHGEPSKAAHHEAAPAGAHEEHPAGAIVEKQDSMPVETTEPNAEPAHH